MMGNTTRRCELAVGLMLALHVGSAAAAEPGLLGTAADWAVRTAGENDRVSVAPAATPPGGLILTYTLSADGAWVSVRRALPEARDFSGDEGFHLRVSGDASGVQLHVDLAGTNDAGFLRRSVPELAWMA